MKLAVRSWGDGPRTALLVHGFSDDALTWWRVGPSLAEKGYTVLAPDLRGHGGSARCSSYGVEDFAGDLVDTLPRGADLALGHSLGAMALGLAAARLKARRTVFADPAWLRTAVAGALDRPLPAGPDQLPPGWAPADVAADLASNALVDPRIGPCLAEALRGGPFAPPPAPEPGSVVLVPELDPVLPPQAHPLLEALGYRIVTQASVRHVMHRDDPAAFLAVLHDQLRRDELVA